MGDSGLIAQFLVAASGGAVAVTNAAVGCIVIHRALVDRACADEGVGACELIATAAPVDWTAVDFDDSSWPCATKHTEWDVVPKNGNNENHWDWDAMVLCKATRFCAVG